MSPRFVLGQENVPCVAEAVNRSLKADCTDFTLTLITWSLPRIKFTRIDVVYNKTTSILYQLHPIKNLSESHSLHEKNWKTY